jgi:aromatic-L-amino-acid decarboxylase
MNTRIEQLRSRVAPLEMSEDQFRALGYELVDRVAGLLGTLRERPVTPAETAEAVRTVLDSNRALPEEGADPGDLLTRATDLLFEHSLFNGHPRFYGYITSSAAPIGMLADLLAAVVNANVGAWKLSPMATEIESQVIRWLAQFIGYPADCGGLLLSGGNMANFTCFVAARAAQAGWDVRKQGVAHAPRLVAYASAEAHTWIQKAADLTGLGTGAIRWIPVDSRQRMDFAALEEQYRRDIDEGFQPLLVAGSAGTVSTGAVDPLRELASFCK